MIITNTFRVEQATLGNFPTGSVVGTAASTVDVVGNLGINQTTTGQTLTLPTPTITRPGLQTIVANTGTAAFTIYGATVQPGQQVVIGYQGITNGWTVQTATAAISDPNWTTATAYSIGQIVNYSSQNLICTVAHTSTSVAADAAKWTFFGIQTVAPFLTGTYYFVGAIVTAGSAAAPQGGGILLKCTTAHTAGASFQVETAVWQVLESTSPATAWAASTLYTLDQLAIVNGMLLQSTDSFTSATAFTLAESSSWRFVAPSTISAWVTGAVYFNGALVTNGSKLYERTGGTGVTLATFLLDTANWTQISSAFAIHPYGNYTNFSGDTATVFTVGDVVTLQHPPQVLIVTTGATGFAAAAFSLALTAQDGADFGSFMLANPFTPDLAQNGFTYYGLATSAFTINQPKNAGSVISNGTQSFGQRIRFTLGNISGVSQTITFDPTTYFDSNGTAMAPLTVANTSQLVIEFIATLTATGVYWRQVVASGGMTWLPMVTTAAFTGLTKNAVAVVDTTLSSFNQNLPAAPTTGDQYGLYLYSPFISGYANIGLNGAKLGGFTPGGVYHLNPGILAIFTYVNATVGWEIQAMKGEMPRTDVTLVLAASGPIGAANVTVDLYNEFRIGASSPLLNFTLPTPTDLATFPITIQNVGGTFPYTVNGNLIPIAKAIVFWWNGGAWFPIGSAVFFTAPQPWVATTAYAAGQQVITPGQAIVEAISTFNSSATFGSAEAAFWRYLGPTGIPFSAANTYYYQGQIIIDPLGAYTLVTASTYLATAVPAPAGNFRILNQGQIQAWAPATIYTQGQYAISATGALIIHSAVTSTSAATFTLTEALNWAFVSDNAIGSFVAGAVYLTNQRITTGEAIWQRILVGAAAASFAADQVNWTQITCVGAPLITAVVATGGAVPTVNGVYTFAGIPAGGLPAGVAVGDIATLVAAIWTTTNTILANTCPPAINVGASEAVSVPYGLVGGVYKALGTGSAFISGVSYATATVTPTAGNVNASSAAVFITSAVIPVGNYIMAVSVRGITTSQGLSFGIFDPSGTLVPGSEGLTLQTPLSAVQATGTIDLPVIVPTAGIYTIRIWNSSGGTASVAFSDFNGRSRLSWYGYPTTTQTGQTVDFVSASVATTFPLAFVAQQTVPFTLINSGNIPGSGGVFTLDPTKTYELECVCGGATTGGSQYRYELINVTTGLAVPGAAAGWVQTDVSSTSTFTTGSTAKAIVKAGSGITQVRVDVTSATNPLNSVANATSYLLIKQIGSSTASVLTPMIGATAVLAGTSGLVPAPAISQQTSVLIGNGSAASSWSSKFKVDETTVATTLAITSATVTDAISLYATITTGIITIGGAAQTGALTFGASSAAQTINIGTGTGIPTINIGTTANGTTLSMGVALGTGSTTIRSGTGGFILQGNPVTPMNLGFGITTGSIGIGSSLTTGTMTIGSATMVGALALQSAAIALGGVAAGVITVGTALTTGTVNVATALTTGTLNIGNATQTGNININSGTGSLNLVQITSAVAPTPVAVALGVNAAGKVVTVSSLPTIQRFTASGTYTPTAGMKYCEVELVGSGGGGGGAAAGGAASIGIGGSGSGGGYAKALLTAAQIGASQAVTIGAAGTPGAVGATFGGTGNTTSLGALMSASGGTGGLPGATSGGFSVYAQRGQGGGNGAVTTGTLIATRFGDSATGGFGAIANSGVAIQVGNGGGGPLGAGGIGSSNFVNVAVALNIVGAAAQGFGAGGSGAASAGTGSAAQAGGAGTSGLVIITEYFI